jgi:hypothetical protein
MKDNFPCKCGHYFVEHERGKWPEFREDKDMQNGCFVTVDLLGAYCPCMEYKPDNLKYLEKIYESKHR